MTSSAPREPLRKPKKGDEREALLTAFDHKGRTLGESDEYAVEARGGVPGDRVRVQVSKRRRDLLRVRVLERLENSPRRVAERCQHAGDCGGCSFQAYDYRGQLEEKQRHVREALRVAGLEGVVDVAPTVACEDPWRYRNKMEFSFGNRRWVERTEEAGLRDDFALGLHAPGRFDKILDVRECPIVFEAGERILGSARELALEHGLEPWCVREHVGLLRFLVLRHGVHTGEVMVNLVTSRAEPERIGPYAAALVARHPEITTLVQNITARKAEVAVGEEEFVLHGPGVIHEELCGVRYRISANSFFQTNTLQAERLFEIVREEAALTGSELVLDLYSGTGSISLLLAGLAGSVRGYEQVESSVRDAERNAAENGIEGVEFVLGDVLECLREEREAGRLSEPDVVILDPPRAGLHPKVLPEVEALAPRRIVYVSCNVQRAALDLAHFVEAGYRLRAARPVDLFPHTPHVECVFTLDREARA
ncbi:MAG: 23S rRNA (uracil(1939)-C(5))-methyltransferase RlmD [Planctomycetes bacterium]|nr:23S rRNA (uracil(1939)-C(5))-methyltransferase RlmD [Planctomycetota bacterium]MCB9904766.1 23S rRNA (uracil(1939)-C(5))-methyltransferase RlmD [Planctomycetota bacterium]